MGSAGVSVSAYYYTGSVAIFAGVLVSLGVFLFAYRGYNNKYRSRDRAAAVVDGTAAVLVAFFPTDAPNDVLIPFWWTQRTGSTHYISAVVLFSAFSFFSLFLFPKSKPDGKPLPPNKRVRKWIHILCGIAMVGCMVWAWHDCMTARPIFLPEALALEFFAVSWLVKGRVDRTAVAAARRTLYYVRHPEQLVDKFRNVLLG